MTRVAELMAPYDAGLEVDEYEDDCWRIGEADEHGVPTPHDEDCCTGTRVVMSTDNPRAAWDSYQVIVTEAPERLDRRSHGVVAERRDALLRLLPEARPEDRQIDFDRSWHTGRPAASTVV